MRYKSQRNISLKKDTYYVSEIAPKVYYMNFPTQEEICTTFMRFQEYFESPKFRGKIFTRKEFEAWYIKNSPKGKKTGKFTYTKDWWGFNFPSTILKPFYAGKFDPLTREEKKVLETFKTYSGKYYIVASVGTNTDSKRHEIAHGLYYTNITYHHNVQEILKTVSTKDRNNIYQFFIHGSGYHKSVLEDELHAYILTELPFLKKKGIPIETLKPVREALKKNYQKYIK